MDTDCWSWQMGARLKWSKKYKESFYFNSYCNQKKIFQTIRYSIAEKKFYKLENNFYDISNNEEVKLSLNFERLNFYRPGYGFQIKKNQNFDNNDIDDGIFIQNLNDNKKKCIISLNEISEIENKRTGNIPHYFNHISFNPKGDKFLFFDCWSENLKRKTKIFISNLNGEYESIKNLELASHYAWINEEEILIFCKPINKSLGFYIYNIYLRTFQFMKNLQKQDGHPYIYDDNKMIIDTYPNNFFYRKLFSYDIKMNTEKLIGKFYTHNSSRNGEKKCDLHPRVSQSNKIISVDVAREKFRETFLIKFQ